MRATRLIFVEGLPGSGKSSTARYLAGSLSRAGIASQCFMEVEPNHPLNVGGELHPAGDTPGTGLFEHYTVETYVAEGLRRWHRFVAWASEQQAINILDSYPYQNAARVLLQMDASTDRIREYTADVENMAEPLAPVLIYLDRTGYRKALESTSRQRGEAWTSYVVELVTNCPYARRRGLVGTSGVMTLMTAYEALVRQLMAGSCLPHLTLTNCMGRWPACYEQLGEFLGLDPQASR
jgi:thymidylate kinase